MAFLDNSGDIVLDAVLTKAGREAMASGNGLQITQFSVGDDEINYGQYNKTHPSGSAYYDLEILQTPILEGFTQINANINYGLLTLENMELLYMPEMKKLQKDALDTSTNMNQLYSVGNVYYFAVNSTTRETIIAGDLASVGTFTSGKYIGIADSVSAVKLAYLETGLDTTDITKTATTQAGFLADLQDTRFTISADQRIINNIVSFNSAPTAISNNTTDNTITAASAPSNSDAGTLSTSVLSRNILNYRDYEAMAGEMNIYTATTGGSYTQYTDIVGPGLSYVGFSISVESTLQTEPGGTESVLWANMGGGTLTGASKTYNYIDTMVNVRGRKTGVSLSVPVRIIRQKEA